MNKNMEVSQCDSKTLESSWVQMDDKRNRMVQYVLYRMSRRGARRESTCIQRYKGTFDVFFGTEHRRRRAETEEQFNKEAKQGWRLAADSARISDENAGSEDRKHTSGGVIVAIDSNLGAVSGKMEVVKQELPGTRG